MSNVKQFTDVISQLKLDKMYEGDFFLTWEKSFDEIKGVFAVADALRHLRENNISAKIFDSGLGISLFRDNSTRTRFSFASACNLLGLEEQVLDEKKSQIAHGETVRETANMVSFMADVIGIRDDMFIGEGHKYQKTFMDALEEGYRDGILEQRPTLVNLQCDVDHPTQCMADMLHIIHYFGGVENLKGKKVAMTWAYSPSYGKPLSVPQGVIGLFTRFGMDVTLAHPEGYEVMPEVEEIAKKNAAATGGSFKKCNDMKEAFKDADIVYPKSWAPFKAMEERTKLYQAGDKAGIAELEKKKAKGAFLPSLSMNAGLGTGHLSGTDYAFGSQVWNSFNESVGLTISIPIFSNRQYKTAYNKAKYAITTSQLELLNTQKQLLQTVEGIYLDATSSQTQYTSATERLSYVKESYNLIDEQFSLGMKNTLELLTEKNNYLTAQQEQLQAKYMALMSVQLLNVYQKKPVAENY